MQRRECAKQLHVGDSLLCVCVCVSLFPRYCSFFMYVFMISGLSLLMFILHYVYTTVRKVRGGGSVCASVVCVKRLLEPAIDRL